MKKKLLPLVFAPFVMFALFSVARPARAATAPETPLDEGYQAMYALDFAGARQAFDRWRLQHPDDPRGPASAAASLLFEQLNRRGILEAQFFVDDSVFASHARQPVDPVWRARFDSSLDEAARLAHCRLDRDAGDPDALFSLALVDGLRADEASLLEQRSLAALRDTRDGARWARRLLRDHPDDYDAYLATGITAYIVGSLAAPLRWMLRLGGYAGDREQGLLELSLAAEHGRFLAPFAQILLAIADLRAGRRDAAKQLLTTLRDRFPTNPLFAREVERIEADPR